MEFADNTIISIPMKKKIHSEDRISPPPDPCQIVVAFFKEWAEKNDMLINTDKMKMITLSLRTDHISHSPTFIAERQIDEVSNAKLLGITIDWQLSFNTHVDYACPKTQRLNYLLLKLKRIGMKKRAPLLLHNLHPTDCTSCCSSRVSIYIIT